MSELNELDWKKYEAITKYIYETLGRASGVKIDGFGRNCKLIGKSGLSHQVDVLTSQTDGINSSRTAIECKCLNKRINKDTVMKLSSIIEDTGINKGIIVSKSGFTKGGLLFARHKNIEVVQLNESDEITSGGEPEKIEIGILEVKTNCTIHRPQILSTVIDYEEANSGNDELNPYSITIKLANGNHVPFTKYISAFQDELHDQNRLFESITKSYEINGGFLINKLTNTTSKINGVTFTGMLIKIDSNHDRKFPLEDQVWLIMKEIFEGKVFRICESGLIAEDKK